MFPTRRFFEESLIFRPTWQTKSNKLQKLLKMVFEEEDNPKGSSSVRECYLDSYNSGQTLGTPARQLVKMSHLLCKCE